MTEKIHRNNPEQVTITRTHEPYLQSGFNGAYIRRPLNNSASITSRGAELMELSPVDRAVPWPVDNDAMWRERWRKLAIFDVCMVFVLGVIFALLILAIVTLPSAGQTWRF